MDLNVFNLQKGVEANSFFYQRQKINEYAKALSEKVETQQPTNQLVKERNFAAEQNLNSLPSNKEFKDAMESGEAKIEQSFKDEKTMFTLFNLPDGITYAEIRDIETGNIKYFPALNLHSYGKSNGMYEFTVKTGSLLETII